MFTKEYWNQRAIQFGHTGHSEPFYYSFDQQARLFAIEQLLAQLDNDKNMALDFGCGSGDFIDLLAKQYKQVVGYDVSEVMIEKVKREFIDCPFVYPTCQLSSITSHTYNLILSVTVLQTFDSEDLNSTMNMFSQLLAPNGNIIAMEFFTDDEHNKTSGENKATKKDWQEALNKHHFKVVSTVNFYNPVTDPSISWKKYNSPILRLLKPFKRNVHVQSFLSNRAKKLIKKYNDVIQQQETFCKIYCIQKSQST